MKIVSKSYFSNMMKVLGFGLGLPLIGTWVSITYLETWRFSYEPIHAVIECSGALVAFIILGLIYLNKQKFYTGRPFLTWLACGLVSMGILDLIHAGVEVGDRFVWFHSTATFAGGLFFGLVWLEERFVGRIKGMPIYVGLLTIIFGFVCILFPDLVPIMVIEGEFTLLAKMLNVFGGIGFISAFLYFAAKFKKSELTDDYLLAAHALLFGAAGVLFEESILWDAAWWWWHALRLSAYMILTYFFYQAFISTQTEVSRLNETLSSSNRDLELLNKALKDAHDELENRVEGRTKELTREISERKRSEQEKEKLYVQLLQSQKMEAIGTLVGGIAHDFNNTQTAIRSFSHLGMGHVKEPDVVYELFHDIRKASDRSVELVRQLLLFARKKPMVFSLLDVNDTISDILKMLRRLVNENISLQTDIDGALWPVKADKGGVEQIITNLVLNARDALPEGGVVIVRTENIRVDKEMSKAMENLMPGRYICILVEDTGLGMAKDEIGHIFEPFFSTKETHPEAGTGLGLSVVYGIVKEHKGYVNVVSESGKGSTFKVYLPATDESHVEVADETISVKTHHCGGESLLLVEDDPVVCRATKKVLVDEGYHVVDAGSAKEALELFEKEGARVQLVIIDYGLPDMNGLELIEELCFINPELKTILYSGYIESDFDLRKIEDKGIRFLGKPYEVGDLIVEINDVLSKR